MSAYLSGRRAKVRLGVIGSGEIVRMIASSLAASPICQWAALAGRNASAVAALARDFGIAQTYLDYRELLKDPSVDAVYIATPPDLHPRMIEDAFRAGKHVLCEKPLAIDFASVQQIVALKAAYPDLSFGGCSSRFEICPPVRAARLLVERGRFGRVEHVRLTHVVNFPSPRETWPEWKRQRETSGGGLLADWGVYDLDWLYYLLWADFDPAEVSGRLDFDLESGSDLEIGYSAWLRCGSGLTVLLERRPEYGEKFSRVEIRGTKGGADIPFMPEGDHKRSLECYWARDSSRSEIASSPMCDWGPILSYPITDFCDALLTGRTPSSAIERQRDVHAIIDALYRSARIRRSVLLDGLTSQIRTVASGRV